MTENLIHRSNPPGSHATFGYHHVNSVPSGARTIYLAGQMPLDADGVLTGAGDHLAQTDRTVANTLLALDHAGARPEDVVRTAIHVVSPDPAVLGAVWARLNEGPLAAAFTSSATLLGAAALGMQGQLVELDVIAVTA